MDSNVDTAEPQANVNVIDAELDDLETLEQLAPQLTALTDKHALGMWQSHSLALRAWIVVKHGDPAAAVRLLRTAVASSQRASFELYQTIFVGTRMRWPRPAASMMPCRR